MRKIPTLFLRNPDDMSAVTDEVNPEAAWVFEGEGTSTRKYDGTCVMLDKPLLDGGQWWARREVKPGKDAPDGFRAVSTDDTTGKVVGWEPIEQSSFYAHFREAVAQSPSAPGTYELCGPKINRNPEGYITHRLVRHDDAERPPHQIAHLAPRDLVLAVREIGWEGVVWHHPDGYHMAKLKGRDYRDVPIPASVAAEVATITGVKVTSTGTTAIQNTNTATDLAATGPNYAHPMIREALTTFATWVFNQGSDQAAEGPAATVDRFLAER